MKYRPLRQILRRSGRRRTDLPSAEAPMTEVYSVRRTFSSLDVHGPLPRDSRADELSGLVCTQGGQPIGFGVDVDSQCYRFSLPLEAMAANSGDQKFVARLHDRESTWKVGRSHSSVRGQLTMPSTVLCPSIGTLVRVRISTSSGGALVVHTCALDERSWV